jgi:hypothetical protein
MNHPVGGTMPKSVPATQSSDQDDLVAALQQLAGALALRHDAAADAPSFVDLAVLAEGLSEQLHEFARQLILKAKEREGSSWNDVGTAFGVTRQAAMRRWSE